MSWMVLAWASKQKTGSPTRKAVLLALANRANHDSGKCNPHIDRICEDTEFGERAVRTALDDLCGMGLISRERIRRNGRLGGYYYRFPPEAGGHEKPAAPSAGGQRHETPVEQAAPSAAQEPGQTLNLLGEAVASPEVPPNRRQGRERIRQRWMVTPGAIQHRDGYFDRDDVKTAIDKAIKLYGIEDVGLAIESYGVFLAAPEQFWWSHTYSGLREFLAPKALDRWVPEARPLDTFRVRNGKDSSRVGDVIRALDEHIGMESQP